MVQSPIPSKKKTKQQINLGGGIGQNLKKRGVGSIWGLHEIGEVRNLQPTMN